MRFSRLGRATDDRTRRAALNLKRAKESSRFALTKRALGDSKPGTRYEGCGLGQEGLALRVTGRRTNTSENRRPRWS